MNLGQTELLTENKELTFEKLMETMNAIKTTYPDLYKNRKISLLEKIMNKLGWYRQKEIYVIKDSALNYVFAPDAGRKDTVQLPAPNADRPLNISDDKTTIHLGSK